MIHNMKDEFLTSNIITYMGNKRKMLGNIEDVLEYIKKDLHKDKLTIGDGFSGSGVVSRLFKKHAKTLHANDIAGYSLTLNKCYLASPNRYVLKKIKNYIDELNNLPDTHLLYIPWVSKHWAPQSSKILKNERTYFTPSNGILIDNMRNHIKTIPIKYQHYLLAPLLVKASIHNNTNGQFGSYYKNEQKIGSYGGSKKIDINRITKKIRLDTPLFLTNDCDVRVTCNDANDWVSNIPVLDLVYYDPPYNKHAYNIYYFMLDIINDWNTDIEIPETYRGQPKDWKCSEYNSLSKAKKAIIHLLDNTKSKYILLSYNSGGIIPLNELDEILSTYGTVKKIPVQHNTYNKLKGLASYKRSEHKENIKEFLWLVKQRSIW